MVWGADVPADDWRRLGAREVARRAVQRLERKGKGILLLHDIHQRTVEALPFILDELKVRGFRIVHVVPASADRVPTVTTAADWLPGLRPNPAAPAVPVILIADVQEAEGNLSTKNAEELCSLTPSRETVGRMVGRRHARRMVRAATAPAKSGHAKVKPPKHANGKHAKHAKIAGAKFAEARAATAGQPDVHAFAQ
jgi:hypothetical protein